MNWYVLQVLTGTEAETRDALAADGIEALAPAENRIIRSGGAWRRKAYVLFPGYVFVKVQYDAAMHRRLLKKDVIRILSCGAAPSPLSDGEAVWIQCLGGRLLEPSTVTFDGSGHFRIVEGPLEALEDRIIRIDRHRRRAVVSLTVAGKDLRPEFSVDIVPYKGAESARVDSSPPVQNA